VVSLVRQNIAPSAVELIAKAALKKLRPNDGVVTI